MTSKERWLTIYFAAKYSIKLITLDDEYKIYIHGFKTLDKAREACDNLNKKKGMDKFLIRYEIEKMR